MMLVWNRSLRVFVLLLVPAPTPYQLKNSSKCSFGGPQHCAVYWFPCCIIKKIIWGFLGNKLFSGMALQGQTWVTEMFIIAITCFSDYDLFRLSSVSRLCLGQQQPLLLLLPKPHSLPTASLRPLLPVQAALWPNLPPPLQVSLPPSPLPVQPVSWSTLMRISLW